MILNSELVLDLELLSNFKEYFYIIALPLILVFIVSGYIGLERQNIGKEAGISAHLLVGLAAAGISILQRLIFIYQKGLSESGLGIDPEGQRIIAQVLTGVGFIGAGVILKDKDRVISGITTAATIWTVAIVGIILGSGYIVLGTTLGLVVILFITIRDLSRGINPLISIDKQRQKGRVFNEDNFHF